MKKRIVFPLFLLLLAGGTAAAQNWQEALKQAATAVGDKATDGKMTQYALPGTWTYSAPGVRLEGEEAAAEEALDRLDRKLEQTMRAVEASYEKNKERWVDTLFSLIVGVQP